MDVLQMSAEQLRQARTAARRAAQQAGKRHQPTTAASNGPPASSDAMPMPNGTSVGGGCVNVHSPDALLAMMADMNELAHQAPRPAAEPAPPLPPPDQQAIVLQRALVPSLLAAALDMPGVADANGWDVLRRRFHQSNGGAADQLEEALLDHLLIVHLRAARLQAEAANAKGFEVFKLYSAVAARFLGEFRRLIDTLQTYRRRRDAAAHRSRRRKIQGKNAGQ